MTRWSIGLLLLGIGLVLVVGGVKLLSLGGSLYYALGGSACVVSGLAIIRGRAGGILLYAVFLIATAIWSLDEVGAHFWPLLPRLAGPAAIAALLALPAARRRITASSGPLTCWAAPFAAMLSVAMLSIGYLADRTTFSSHAGAAAVARAHSGPDDWAAFGRTVTGTRYSPATEITPENVGRLRQAWVYRTGESAAAMPNVNAKFSFLATPLAVDGIVYICTPLGNVVAIDGDSGRARWKFDAKVVLGDAPMLNCRGVSYHRDAPRRDECAARILSTTIDGRLIALDAHSGRRCAGFGINGEVSLHEGLGAVTPAAEYTSSPPVVIGDTAVLGAYVRDNYSTNEPSGVVRAFDVRTGKLRWAWDAGRPDGAAPLKPGQTYTRGSPNAWSVLSGDPALGLVYVPTGNATPDHVGMHRTSQAEKYSSSVVALDARTGHVRWHFQTTHHDIWDYDVPAQPVSFDLPVGARSVPALAVPTKRGEIFILDRRTGWPLTPTKEWPVPAGAIPGERYAPTQPYSTGFPSFAPAPLREADMWGMTPLDQLWCRIKFRSLDYTGNFTPPSLRGAIQYPGIFGALNWGSVSVDEGRRLMFANTAALPNIVRLLPRANVSALEAVSKDMHSGFLPQTGTPYALTLQALLSPFGVPCNPPPWGTLAAIDLETRKILWQRPLGTTEDSAPLGIAVPGVFNIGGSVVTRSGVLFIAATLDNYLRAFDVSSGRELWRGRLPASAQAGAMTFTSPRSHRQYVVIAAGGHGFLGTTPGDHAIAYRLP